MSEFTVDFSKGSIPTQKISATRTQGADYVSFAGETEEERKPRVQLFFERETSAKWYAVGRLLAMELDGETLAARVARGEVLNLPEIPLQRADGTILSVPVSNPKLSLQTCTAGAKGWACLVCSDAHGAGGHHAKAVSVKRLTSNKFYWNPSTHQLVTVSETCFDTWLNGSYGLTSYRPRFMVAPASFALPAAVTASAGQESTPSAPAPEIAPTATQEPKKGGSKK